MPHQQNWLLRVGLLGTGMWVVIAHAGLVPTWHEVTHPQPIHISPPPPIKIQPPSLPPSPGQIGWALGKAGKDIVNASITGPLGVPASMLKQSPGVDAAALLRKPLNRITRLDLGKVLKSAALVSDDLLQDGQNTGAALGASIHGVLGDAGDVGLCLIGRTGCTTDDLADIASGGTITALKFSVNIVSGGISVIDESRITGPAAQTIESKSLKDVRWFDDRLVDINNIDSRVAADIKTLGSKGSSLIDRATSSLLPKVLELQGGASADLFDKAFNTFAFSNVYDQFVRTNVDLINNGLNTIIGVYTGTTAWIVDGGGGAAGGVALAAADAAKQLLFYFTVSAPGNPRAVVAGPEFSGPHDLQAQLSLSAVRTVLNGATMGPFYLNNSADENPAEYVRIGGFSIWFDDQTKTAMVSATNATIKTRVVFDSHNQMPNPEVKVNKLVMQFVPEVVIKKNDGARKVFLTFAPHILLLELDGYVDRVSRMAAYAINDLLARNPPLSMDVTALLLPEVKQQIRMIKGPDKFEDQTRAFEIMNPSVGFTLDSEHLTLLSRITNDPSAH